MRFLTKLVIAFVLSVLCGIGAAMAQGGNKLWVIVPGIGDNKPISEEFAFCIPAQSGHTTKGGNISPEISWRRAPEGTKSYAIIMVDPDVPATFDNANTEGKTLLKDMPRQDFYHWVLVDIPAPLTKLEKGVESAGGTTPKPAGKMQHGVRGINSYSANNGGYDGPCPPWNDERLHHYHFKVFALDVESLGLEGIFGGTEVMQAMRGHVLAEGEVVGTFTNNPKLR